MPRRGCKCAPIDISDGSLSGTTVASGLPIMPSTIDAHDFEDALPATFEDNEAPPSTKRFGEIELAYAVARSLDDEDPTLEFSPERTKSLLASAFPNGQPYDLDFDIDQAISAIEDTPPREEGVARSVNGVVIALWAVAAAGVGVCVTLAAGTV